MCPRRTRLIHDSLFTCNCAAIPEEAASSCTIAIVRWIDLSCGAEVRGQCTAGRAWRMPPCSRQNGQPDVHGPMSHVKARGPLRAIRQCRGE